MEVFPNDFVAGQIGKLYPTRSGEVRESPPNCFTAKFINSLNVFEVHTWLENTRSGYRPSRPSVSSRRRESCDVYASNAICTNAHTYIYLITRRLRRLYCNRYFRAPKCRHRNQTARSLISPVFFRRPPSSLVCTFYWRLRAGSNARTCYVAIITMLYKGWAHARVCVSCAKSTGRVRFVYLYRINASQTRYIYIYIFI